MQEIPAVSARTHGSRLRTVVTLQGIYEESPVCTVACNWGQDTFLQIWLEGVSR